MNNSENNKMDGANDSIEQVIHDYNLTITKEEALEYGLDAESLKVIAEEDKLRVPSSPYALQLEFDSLRFLGSSSQMDSLLLEEMDLFYTNAYKTIGQRFGLSYKQANPDDIQNGTFAVQFEHHGSLNGCEGFHSLLFSGIRSKDAFLQLHADIAQVCPANVTALYRDYKGKLYSSDIADSASFQRRDMKNWDVCAFLSEPISDLNVSPSLLHKFDFAKDYSCENFLVAFEGEVKNVSKLAFCHVEMGSIGLDASDMIINAIAPSLGDVIDLSKTTEYTIYVGDAVDTAYRMSNLFIDLTNHACSKVDLSTQIVPSYVLSIIKDDAVREYSQFKYLREKGLIEPELLAECKSLLDTLRQPKDSDSISERKISAKVVSFSSARNGNVKNQKSCDDRNDTSL